MLKAPVAVVPSSRSAKAWISVSLFATVVMSALIPANVEILLVGVIWPATVLIF